MRPAPVEEFTDAAAVVTVPREIAVPASKPPFPIHPARVDDPHADQTARGQSSPLLAWLLGAWFVGAAWGAVRLAWGMLQVAKVRRLATQAPEGPKASVVVRQMDVEQVFDRIRRDTGVPIKAFGAVKGKKLDLKIQNQPLEKILDQIATTNQWIVQKENDGSYGMYDKDSYVKIVQAGQVIRKPFELKHIDALARRLGELVPPGLGEARADLEKNFRAALQAGLAKLDLVTREEFEVQRAVLARTREKLEALERTLAEIDARLGGTPRD